MKKKKKSPIKRYLLYIYFFFLAIAVAEGPTEASVDPFWEEIQGKKLLKSFKKRCYPRENFFIFKDQNIP